MARGIDILTALGYLGLGAAALMRAAQSERDKPLYPQFSRLPPTQKLTGESRLDFNKLVEQFAKDAGVSTSDPRFQTKTRDYDFSRISDKVTLIARLARAGGKHPLIIRLKNQILTKRCRKPNYKTGDGGWCVLEKEWEKEAIALFNWIRAHIRYTRDPVHTDLFTAAEQTLIMQAADCDDYVVTMGALAAAAGMKVKARVIQTTDAPSYNHIYLLINPAGDGKKWVPADPSVAKPLGWEAPGAADAVRTGKPSGIVSKVRDFDIA